MEASKFQAELLREVEGLKEEDRRRVLHFARSMRKRRVRGTPGAKLLEFAGSISPDQLDEMERAIEEGCERVDPDGW